MAFSNDKAIYLQIADRMADEILAGHYKADDRIPSVREYAVALEVNANTAVKAYDQLARDGIIYNKRGLGYFVAQGAHDAIFAKRRQIFIDEILPQVFRQMKLLGLGMQDIEKQYAAMADQNIIISG